MRSWGLVIKRFGKLDSMGISSRSLGSAATTISAAAIVGIYRTS
jgi:hypothetical protein